MNNYNPNIHHRRSIRLKGYDYSQSGLYFITICCENMCCRFGHIENEEMILNEFGTISYNQWAKLPDRFPNFELDIFQIMPNHMHGIILLNNPPVRAGFTPAQNNGNNQNDSPAQNNGNNQNDTPAQNNGNNQNDSPAQNNGNNQNDTVRATLAVAPKVSDIVGAYKSLVANGCLNIYKQKNKTMGKLWQRNYYEHIIRNEQSYHRISQYILNNPKKWKGDKFYKK